LSDVGRGRARSAQIGGPDGISHRFQISAYSGEPFTSKAACNLFSKDNWRSADVNESGEVGPEVSGIGGSAVPAGVREWLARTTSCPNRDIWGPSSQTEGAIPPADAGKEVGLGIFKTVVGGEFFNGSSVNGASCDMAGSNEVLEPLSGVRVVFVVKGRHD